MRIYKEALPIGSGESIEIPGACQILHCAMQMGTPMVWYLHSDGNQRVTIITAFYTGFDKVQQHCKHIGTLLMMKDQLVVHYFITANKKL